MLVPEKFKVIGALNERATVLTALDTASGEQRVLKYLDPEYLPLYKKLLEIKPHKNLETIFELAVYDEYFIAVCGFIDGKTLRELLDEGRVFGLGEIKSIVMQLCDAVELLSNNQLVHRDINPNNIMIDEKNSVKLIDFNIARQIKGTSTRDTEILGTRDYTAPEQYGFLETRCSADVFSIGKVMKTLLETNEDTANSYFGQSIVEYATRFDPATRCLPLQMKYMVKFLVPNMPMNPWNILRYCGFKDLGDKFEDFWKN